MISAIKSDNPIELLNYISNTFRQSALTSALQQHLCPVHTYSLIQSATQAVTQSISLSHCRTVPLSLHPTVRRAVSQSASVSCRYSVTQSEANASPGPLPESEWRTSVYLISLLIVAACSARSVYFYTILLVYFSSCYQNVK